MKSLDLGRLTRTVRSWLSSLRRPAVPPPSWAALLDQAGDLVMGAIDAEPDEDVKRQLLQRAYRQEWDLSRIPPDPADPDDGGKLVLRFAGLRTYTVELVRLGARRSDA